MLCLKQGTFFCPFLGNVLKLSPWETLTVGSEPLGLEGAGASCPTAVEPAEHNWCEGAGGRTFPWNDMLVPDSLHSSATPSQRTV